jgi:hypothetical protein
MLRLCSKIGISFWNFPCFYYEQKVANFSRSLMVKTELLIWQDFRTMLNKLFSFQPWIKLKPVFPASLWVFDLQWGSSFGVGLIILLLQLSLCCWNLLSYKPESRGIDFRWCHWKFFWHNPSCRSMALGSTQPLTEMSTRNISWGKDGLTTLPPSYADCLKIW